MIFRLIADDLRFYSARSRPDGRATAWGVLRACLIEKGWWLLLGYRFAQYASSRRSRLSNPLWWITRILASLFYYGNVIANKSEALADCDMPGPVYFSRGGHYMIGARAIGSGTVLQRHVTFGMAVTNGNEERPVIGKNVWIGQDCVIAGNLEVGHGATILPGSYVTIDVPAGAVAAGNPARVIRTNYDNDEARNLIASTGFPPGLEP